MYRILFLLRVLSSLDWLKFFRLYDRTSDNIVWLLPGRPNFKGIVLYLMSYSDHLNDAALLNGLLSADQSFRVVFGKKVGKLYNKNIFYSISPHFNIYGFHNYSAAMTSVLRQVARQGNKLFPDTYEAQWWENKAFMHHKFDELGISQPQTQIVYHDSDVDYECLTYPILLKEVHSCSSLGVHKAQDEAALRRLIAEKKAKGATVFLLQKLINMRRDLRVILVGDIIVSHYWRINQSKDWRPTSTGHGSTVEFEYFPEQWRSFIIEQFKRLNLRTGAFDIAWENDDVSTTPLILEVSPSYQPNPKPSDTMKKLSYAIYKKKYIGAGNYHTAYIDIVFDIKKQLVASYFSNNVKVQTQHDSVVMSENTPSVSNSL